jgi:uncharacterized RDD family membrane protein YckC
MTTAEGAFGATTSPATGQHEAAGFGRRLGAYLLDAIIVGVLAVVLVGLFSVVAGEAGFIVSYAIVLVASLFYAPVLMARQGDKNGQTWGKQATSVRVVREGGGPVTFGTGAVRDVVGKGLLGIFLLPTLASIVMVLVRGDKKAIHDLIAGTRVVGA